MNWVLVVLGVAVATAGSEGAYRQYEQVPAPAQRYQGPPVVPVVLPGGYIADTEEVARAKDLHFNAYAQAASAVKDSRYTAPQQEYSAPQQLYTAAQRSYSAPQQSYTGPQHSYSGSRPSYNSPQASYTGPQGSYTGPQGSYTSTQASYIGPQAQYSSPQQEYSRQPQRQQDYNVPRQQYTGPASDESYSEPKPTVNYQQPSYSAQPRYQGPPVIPVILPNGYIAETADVEAAKQHHFQLVAQAQAAVARAQERANSKKYGYTPSHPQQVEDDDHYEDPEQEYNQVYQAAPSSPVYTATPRKPYQGPPVVPVVLPSGHIADTAEVAAAKISHLQQLLDAAQKSLPQQQYHASRQN